MLGAHAVMDAVGGKPGRHAGGCPSPPSWPDTSPSGCLRQPDRQAFTNQIPHIRALKRAAVADPSEVTHARRNGAGVGMIDREKIGKRLILFAWGIEAVAAVIGLTIAAFIILTTRDQVVGLGESAGPQLYMSMFLGGLPFIVVAIVELTKIPLAHAAYLANSMLWRLVLAFGLMLLMIITFETMANGFERNFSLRNSVITNYRKELQHTNEQAEAVSAEITRLQRESEQALIDRRETELKSLNEAHQAEIDRVQLQKQDARKTYGDAAKDGKEAELKGVVDRLKAVASQRDAELAEVDNRYRQKTTQIGSNVDGQRGALQQQTETIRRQIADISERERTQLAAVQDDPNIDRQRQTEIDRVRQDHDTLASQAKASVEAESTRLQNTISQGEEKLAAIYQDIKKEVDSSFLKLKNEAEARKPYQGQIDTIQQTIAAARQKISGLSLSSTLRDIAADRDRRIELVNQKFDAQGGQAGQRRNEIRRSANAERSDANQRLKALEARLANLSTDSSIDQASVQRGEERQEIEQRFERERQALSTREAELRTEIARIVTNTQQQLQPVLADLVVRETTENERFDRRRAEIEAWFTAAMTRLSTRKAQIESLEDQLTKLEQRRVEVRDQIGQQSQAAQIYRFAQYVYGVEAAADVTPEQVRTVAFVWFGSLAAITAWTGTLLAFGGLVLRYGHQRGERVPSGPVTRALRGFLVAGARRLRQPIIREIPVDREVIREAIKEIPVEKIVIQDVVREVPVDKVVFKEVPREVIRKEIVYLPFFTDDPELIRATMDDQRAARPRPEQSEETPSTAAAPVPSFKRLKRAEASES